MHRQPPIARARAVALPRPESAGQLEWLVAAVAVLAILVALLAS